MPTPVLDVTGTRAVGASMPALAASFNRPGARGRAAYAVIRLGVCRRGGPGRRWSAVDVAPVSDAGDDHEEHVVEDRKDDAVVSDADAPQVVVTLELLAAGRPRVLGELVELAQDARSNRLVETGNLLASERREFDAKFQAVTVDRALA